MKRWVWGLLLAWVSGGLCAWVVWQSSANQTEEVHTLWEVPLADLAALQYDWPDGRITLSRAETFFGAEYPVLHQPRIRDENQPTTARGGAGRSEPRKSMSFATSLAEPTRFPAGKATMRALEALLPLRVRKHLGMADRNQLAAMGLARPQRRLTLRGSSQDLVLELGAETQGHHGRYMRRVGDADVYILPAAAWRGLEGGALRLMEPKLVYTELLEMSGFSIAYRGETYDWVVRHRAQMPNRYFSTANVDEALPEVDDMVSLLRNLRVRTYLPAPDPTGFEKIAVFSFRRAGDEVEELVMYRDPAASQVIVACRGWWADINPTVGQHIVAAMRELVD